VAASVPEPDVPEPDVPGPVVPEADAALPIGSTAPDFTLKDQNNGEVTLSEFRGAKNVVLLFYPATFTGVCQGELRAIQDNLATFQNEDVQVLTVSVDSSFANKVWADQEGFTFPILSDFWPHGAVAQAYGVFNATVGRATRGTFVIDKEGTVRWTVVNGLPDARDHDEYARVLKEL
jgi:mycoredoxin-dependent peroxiredoxin